MIADQTGLDFKWKFLQETCSYNIMKNAASVALIITRGRMDVLERYTGKEFV